MQGGEAGGVQEGARRRRGTRSLAGPLIPFGGVSSMSFFWQKVAGKMAWEEAW